MIIFEVLPTKKICKSRFEKVYFLFRPSTVYVPLELTETTLHIYAGKTMLIKILTSVRLK